MNQAAPARPWIHRMFAKMAASRFFTMSVLLHLPLVLALSGVVLCEAYAPRDFAPMEAKVSTELPKSPKPDADDREVPMPFEPVGPSEKPVIEIIHVHAPTQVRFPEIGPREPAP